MSVGSDKNNFSVSSGMTNQEIKATLISIYDKINKPPTKEVGYDLFLKLVHKNLFSAPQMNLIINHAGEFISPLSPKEKEPCLKLLSLIFYSPSNEEESFDPKIYYPYLSPVLTILQNLIKDSNSPNFPTISNIFAEIVQNIMPTDIEASNIELGEEEKTAYEMLQGFCIYNMKYDDKSNRIVGSLCLTKLVENCPIVLQKQYMKLIWEVIINLIDKKNFNAKYELLNCLISLILGAENLFTPYAHNTLYKVLDFLADSDWLKRKLALNVIYTLIFYCKEEILPLKEHIISFLRALKTDKVKEVREVCLLILKIFSENEQKTGKENKISGNINNKKKSVNKNDSKNKVKKPIIKEKIKKGGGIVNKFNPGNNDNKFTECLVPELRENKSPDDKDKDKEIEQVNVDMDNNNKNSRSKLGYGANHFSLVDQDLNNINNVNNVNNLNENNNNIISSSANSQSRKGGLSATMKNQQKENSNDLGNINPSKLVNRKDDKTFINEKMVIKPDPNKSIFKSNPNPAFFNQANNKSKDIVLVSKAEPRKPIPNNNINIQNKKEEVNKTEGVNTKNNPPENVTNPTANNTNSTPIKNEEKESSAPQNKIGPIKRGNKLKEKSKDNNKKNINIKPKEKKVISNENKVNEVENNESSVINTLLSQMNSLSEKQLSLIDIMDNIQMETQGQIKELNKRIGKLERNLEELNNELYSMKNEDD